MNANDDVVLFAASYSSLDEAKPDIEVLKGLADDGDLRKLSVITLTKNADGKLTIHQKTEQGRKGAWIGVAAGLVLGAIFPPAGLTVLGSSVAGGVGLGLIGGAIGHFEGSISRDELRDIGKLLDAGDAAVIAVAEDAITADVDKALAHASKKANKQIAKGNVNAALNELSKGMDKADAVLASA